MIRPINSNTTATASINREVKRLCRPHQTCRLYPRSVMNASLMSVSCQTLMRWALAEHGRKTFNWRTTFNRKSSLYFYSCSILADSTGKLWLPSLGLTTPVITIITLNMDGDFTSQQNFLDVVVIKSAQDSGAFLVTRKNFHVKKSLLCFEAF